MVVCLGVAGSVFAQDSALLLSSVSLSSTSVTEGRSLQGTVTLNMAAPADGVAVSLAADRQALPRYRLALRFPPALPARPSRSAQTRRARSRSMVTTA